jgi:small subunit ribosomal protein S17
VADEENKNIEENEAVEPAAEESTSTAETPAGEDSSAASEDASVDDSASSAGAESEEGAEPEGALPPKERRKREKASRNRKPRYMGTLEERRAQRDAHRAKKAVQRRAHRAKQRDAHKAAGPREGTPPAPKVPGRKKIQQGVVVSSKADKTITVEIQLQESHRIYKKVVRHTKKLTAHDEKNEAGEGDTVRVIESRPMSKTKRWRLTEIVERAR